MNYKSINTAILYSEDIPKDVTRDNKFYDYLLDNNVAYYYCKHVSKEKTAMDKKIIKAGDILNRKFSKTLKLIDKVCKENSIRFLLFKTYKYIPEVVDGDIDLFIKEKDFYNFLKALEREGFNCFENEYFKAVCRKKGFCNIEPRINSSFHELVILNEKEIWEKIDVVKLEGMQLFKVLKEIDLLHLLVSILYNPNYLKLYLFLIYKNSDIRKLYTLSSEKHINQDLNFLLKNLITENVENKRFPLFMGNINFTIWWFKRILLNPHISLFQKLKHILFFFYSKYNFLIFNKLVFRHTWLL